MDLKSPYCKCFLTKAPQKANIVHKMNANSNPDRRSDNMEEYNQVLNYLQEKEITIHCYISSRAALS